MKKRRTTEDILCNPFGFRIVWDALDHWADFVAYEIVSRLHPNDEPLFHKLMATSSEEHVMEHNLADIHVKGYIKWDGCSNIEFTEQHFCGVGDYLKHFELLEYLYRRAYVLMGKEPLEPWITYEPINVNKQIKEQADGEARVID